MLKQISSLVDIGDGPEAARLAVEPLVPRIGRMSEGYRSQLRTRMKKSGYLADTVDAIFPYKASSLSLGDWKPLARAGRQAVQAVNETPLTEIEWTLESARASACAIADAYPNTATAATQLSRFRNILKECGVDHSIVYATRMPEITTMHNAAAAKARKAAACAPLTIPDRYQRISDLVDRVDRYNNETELFVPDADIAADFLVVFAARPGEAESIHLGPDGGLLGRHRKRDAPQAEIPIDSAVGEDAARKFLARWRGAKDSQRKRAMRSLSFTIHTLGVYRKDLRAIGADMAVRAAKLRGEDSSTGPARELKIGIGDAVSGSTLAAKLAELSPDTLKRISDMIVETKDSVRAERPSNIAKLTRRERRTLTASME